MSFESMLVAEELEERVEFQVSGGFEAEGGSNGVDYVGGWVSVGFETIGNFFQSIWNAIF